MKRNSKLVKAMAHFYQKLCNSSPSTIKEQSLWLLRAFLITRRQTDWVNAGFVLPTVAMVALVVVLLTTAILFRSFERSKNASNVRVNEATLNSAVPALDRARAKLNKLFEDRRLPRATPTDVAIEGHLNNYLNEYTFGDETQLMLEHEEKSISPPQKSQLMTAWKYPVDTDNNGKFDSYTLYGVFFKNPPVSNGKYTRPRNPLEARTPPMLTGNVSGSCEDSIGTSATLVGNSGWFNVGGKLKKSFFVYTATVPITSSSLPTGYERYKGNKGFSSLEYQQDRVQLPLVNNAVVYEDDIALAPGTDFNLNGRIITNSNFITGGVGSAVIRLYQVSSDESCFYDPDNAKIILGGNLGGGGFTDSSDLGSGTKVDLYAGKGVDPTSSPIVKDNKSVDAAPQDIAYNSLAYVKRINRLVTAQMGNAATSDPQEVKDGIQKEKQKLGLSSYTLEEEERLRRQQIELYFKRRTRRVPYTEVPFNSADSVVLGAYVTTNPLQGSGDTLRPPDAWIYPNDPADGKTATNYAKLALKTSSDKLLPGATEPNKLQIELEGKEKFLGDRTLIGNNLPQLWWDKNKNEFVGPERNDTQNIKDTKWDDGNGVRNRRTRIEQLADLGAIERDKDWELAAADKPDAASQDYTYGGLRVVTGAGIYLPSSLVVNSPATSFNTALAATDSIWSDMMPVPSSKASINAVDSRDAFNGFNYSTINLPNVNTPYLRMRASVVYHYAGITNYDKKSPQPIACVSSYYDPTNATTARNRSGLPDVSPIESPNNNTNNGNSNNGVVYGPPTGSSTTYQAALNYQAQLKYPNGRWVNKPLKDALAKSATNRTLSEKSAIDSALCALQILDNTISISTVIPHGAIRETAFLDARQVKAIHQDVPGTAALETYTNADGGASVSALADYNLPTEDRQPLEIRATVLDIDALRKKSIGSSTPAQEYLIPNSGIVYATRDDALVDLSAPKPTTSISITQKEEQQRIESPVDFILDPTRRPNAIMLINGKEIWREESYRDAEKGLIVASNLPVYIRGNFNEHTQEEFKDAGKLADNWSNFYLRVKANLNPHFACRKGDPRLPNCTIGDKWRPASVLADSITLLSNNFRQGFRNEGDYDLNNNLGDKASVDGNTTVTPIIYGFKQNGFSANAYVPNATWYNASGTDAGYPKDHDTVADVQGSSYLNNFVTPIQRRANFNEYLMEVCPKLPVSMCGPSDWFVDLHPTNSTDTTSRKRTWDISGGIVNQALSNLESGSTATPAATIYQRYPRRVAFKRDSTGKVVLDASNRPIPLGINSSGQVQEYPYGGTNSPRAVDNALWFRTTTTLSNLRADDDTAKDPTITSSIGLMLAELPPALPLLTPQYQPRLLPVLQINRPFGTPSTQVTDKVGPGNGTTNIHKYWLQVATETIFNLAAAAGDTPARPTEDNGGLHNFVRFLENWNPTGTPADAVKARMSGSFIQIKRSAYATGPFRALLTSEYQIVGNQNRAPFYLAPKRQWGYDVGLLSQSPDLFAQKLVRAPEDLPDEFFREVGRDDVWVKTLLCSKQLSTGGTYQYAIDEDQRPCK